MGCIGCWMIWGMIFSRNSRNYRPNQTSDSFCMKAGNSTRGCSIPSPECHPSGSDLYTRFVHLWCPHARTRTRTYTRTPHLILPFFLPPFLPFLESHVRSMCNCENASKILCISIIHCCHCQLPVPRRAR